MAFVAHKATDTQKAHKAHKAQNAFENEKDKRWH